MMSIEEQLSEHPEVQLLAPRQREVLVALVSFLQEQGYPPSIQQLCEMTGLSSTSTIHYHVSALKKRGMIDWNPAEKRSMTVRTDLLPDAGSGSSLEEKSASLHELPMLGTIAAGSPLRTSEDYGERLNLGTDLCPEGCYALRVKGFSMIEDHIMDGDIVIINPEVSVRDGDTVVALVEGESATLKRIYREPDRIRLQPANAEMEPIYSTDVQVQGKVESIIRKLG